LAEQGIQRSGSGPSANDRLDTLGRIAFGGLGVVGLIAFAGMIYTIFVKFILDGSAVFTGIIFILLLLFAALGLTFVVLNESRKERRAEGGPSDPLELASSGLFERLDDGMTSTSVTDDTTRHLIAEPRTRKFE
jgi:hypothetical protein